LLSNLSTWINFFSPPFQFKLTPGFEHLSQLLSLLSDADRLTELDINRLCMIDLATFAQLPAESTSDYENRIFSALEESRSLVEQRVVREIVAALPSLRRLTISIIITEYSEGKERTWERDEGGDIWTARDYPCCQCDKRGKVYYHVKDDTFTFWPW
jgi:hypothetical protein